ncbi:ELKS/Rab6-interacting/CAST family member 1 [Exaiptasia diaphana]|uniref:Uncharacterized protein n=1 Tax=Exaiptasia diaphana TaxID=2652724 RepID=A0A913YIT0_EXADI|nr:ELKS/Rab6-interacting/CAST family member 1 [Exaiptasia diaphana]
MMRKLRDLQSQLDERSNDVSRKESKLLMLEAEKDTAVKRLRDVQEEYAAEKRQLVNEIVSLKKLKDMSQRDSTRKEMQVHQFKVEAEKGLTSLQEAERKIQSYRTEIDRKSEELSSLRIQLEEQRAETLRLKTQLQEMDDRFFDSQAKTKEQLSRELREEIRQLRLQLKEKEISAEQDRSLRNKVLLALFFVRDIYIMSAIKPEIKESNKQLKHELEKTQDLLRLEQSAHRNDLDKLSKEEQVSLEASLQRNHLRNELSEAEMLHNSADQENMALKRDKILLTDEVASLNAKLDDKEEEIESIKLQLEEAETRVAQLESKNRLQRNLESIKWEEFEKLATTMKAFSRNMNSGKHDKEMDYD